MLKKDQLVAMVLLSAASSIASAQTGELIAKGESFDSRKEYLKLGCAWQFLYTDASGGAGFTFSVSALVCDSMTVLYKKHYAMRLDGCKVNSPAPGYTLTGTYCFQYSLYKTGQ